MKNRTEQNKTFFSSPNSMKKGTELKPFQCSPREALPHHPPGDFLFEKCAPLTLTLHWLWLTPICVLVQCRKEKRQLWWLKTVFFLKQNNVTIHCKIFMSQAQLLCGTPWSCCSSQAPSPCGSPRCRRRSATSCQSQEEPRTWKMREYMFCLRIFFNSIREFSSVKTFFLFFPLLRALALIFSWQAQIDLQASWI